MRIERTPCPVCGKLLIPPMHIDRKIMVVGEAPGVDETKEGRPFTRKNPNKPRDRIRSGDILFNELLRVGLHMDEIALTNLWQHVIDEKVCNADWHVDQLAKSFAGKEHVLLLGTRVTEALLGGKFREYAGLQVSIPGFESVHFFVGPSINSLFASPLGEMRLTLARFAYDIKLERKSQ